MMPVHVVLIFTLILALTISSLAVGFVCAFWKTKACLLGVRPACGIMMLYKVSVILSVTMAFMLMTPFGLLATVPGMVMGATIALLDVVKMDDNERQRFLRSNSGRYFDPLTITHSGSVQGH